MSNIVDLSIILINWNSLEVTSDALTSIREQTQGITYEVIVIDNGSTRDNSMTELPRRFPWIHLIRNPDNRGFTRANNQSIEHACGRYVLLLNNDTIQTENALGAAVRYLDDHTEIGALGILHRNNDPERSFQPSFFTFPQPIQQVFGLFGLVRECRPPIVREQEVDWLCGSFLMIRRGCLNQVGMLDERYFIYDEDIDWCFQARRQGWKVRFWPQVSMIHLGAAASPLMRDKTLVMFRSRVSYLRKNHGRITALAFYLAMGLKLTLAVAKQGLWLLIGRASRRDLRQRWQRQWNFLLLRPGRVGG